ncbi:MAG: glycosyltransferase [Candidatus Levybacteria bacterium]|nr:glycosyltransferase [Candidatus Levybacteria bacterium]
MTILLDTDNYKPAVNGIVSHILLIKEELEKRGHTVIIVAPSYGKRNGKPEENVYRLRAINNPLRSLDKLVLPFDPAVESAILRYPIDIVHSHLFLSGFFGLQIARKKHIPKVATLHTLFGYYWQWLLPHVGGVTNPVTDLVQRFYFEYYDAVIAPSSKAVSALKKARVKTRIALIHNGIKPDPFIHADASLFRSTYHVSKNTRLLVLAGRVDPGKNIDLALRAMQRIIKKTPDVKLAIVGDGLQRKKIEKLIKRLNLTRYVFITGFVDLAMVASANKAATAALFTSTHDTFSTVAMETIVSGTPMISVKDKAVVGIVRDHHNGIFTSTKPNNIASSILDYLANPALEQKLREGCLADRKKFSIEHTVDKLLALYTEYIEQYKNEKSFMDVSKP